MTTYDAYNRKGYALEFGLKRHKQFARLVSPDGNTISKTEVEPTGTDHGEIDFEFELSGGSGCLRINSSKCFDFAVEPNSRGPIALTRGAFLGELRFHSLSIETDDHIEQSIIWQELEVPFAPINGMDIPIVWTVNAVRLGNASVIEVELSGGEKTRPDIPWFPYHGHYAESLERPYLRIESDNRRYELSLSDETLVLANPSTKYFYSDGLGHKNPPWPL